MGETDTQHAETRQKLERGEWSAAFEVLAEVDACDGLDAEHLELLVEAARFAGRYDQMLDPLERALAAYTRRGRTCAAARVALTLCDLHIDRQELAVARGW